MTRSIQVKAVLFSALNLIANSTLASSTPEKSAHGPAAKPKAPEQNSAHRLSSSQFEASFLKVYAGCKVSHPSFAPVPVGIESVSERVLGIHAQLGQV